MGKAFRSGIPSAEITPKEAYLNRRQLMTGMGALAAAGAAGPALAKLTTVPSKYSTDMKPNSLEDITHYNNFYEFGLQKTDPAAYAGKLTVDPWSVEIGGLVDKPGNYALDDILKGVTLEERVYRFRCVEAWSMVIPWDGFPLSTLLDRWGCSRGRSTSRSRPSFARQRCPGSDPACSTGPMSRGCGSTRRCIR